MWLTTIETALSRGPVSIARTTTMGMQSKQWEVNIVGKGTAIRNTQILTSTSRANLMSRLERLMTTCGDMRLGFDFVHNVLYRSRGNEARIPRHWMSRQHCSSLVHGDYLSTLFQASSQSAETRAEDVMSRVRTQCLANRRWQTTRGSVNASHCALNRARRIARMEKDEAGMDFREGCTIEVPG